MKQSIKATARRARTEDAKARKLHATADSYQNFAQQIGIGTNNALSASTYGFNPISRIRILLEWIHRGSWIGGVAVDLIAEDMTRAGVTISGEMDAQDITKIERSMTVLGVWNKICDTIKWARLYGGCIAWMMIDGQNPSTPLRLDTIGKGAFKGLLVLDRWMVEPSLNDIVTEQSPDMGLPKYYTITADGYPRTKIHYSRVLRLEGISLPYNQKLQENLWGISILERINDRMISFDSATMGAAQLTYKSFLRTYGIENLREIVSAGGKAMDGLAAMINFMRQTQGQEGITLIDIKDEFKVLTSNAFTGISDIIIHLGEQLSGALQIPLVRLFGQSPVGLNATGESDLRTYYDGIHQKQMSVLDVPVTNMYVASARSLGIAIGPDFGIEWNPLWQLKDEERATVAQTVTATVIAAQESGIVSDKACLQEMKKSSRVTGIWDSISDDEIESADDMPPPKPVLDPETNQPLPPTPAEEKKVPGEKKDVTTDALSPQMFRDLPIFIENQVGTIRKGKGWKVKMNNPYGYIIGTSGVDHDELDCFVGENADAESVYVMHVITEDGFYDEDKVMLGFDSPESAVSALQSNYSMPVKYTMHEVPYAEFLARIQRESGSISPTMIS